MSEEPFAIAYDLRESGSLERSKRDRRFWGSLYTDIYPLDAEHVVMVFRPAPDGRWRPWEAVRRGWILEEAS